MFAALTLEGIGIRLQDVPKLSAMRFSNSGPYALLWTHIKAKKIGGPIILLTILSPTSFAAQFSSTLLLSDVAIQPIAGVPLKSKIAYGIKREGKENLTGNVFESLNYWEQPISQYPAFGEYNRRNQRLYAYDWSFADEDKRAKERAEIRDDTGEDFRALIPIVDWAERERVKNYEGPASIFNARTVCFRPKISISVTNVNNTGTIYVEAASLLEPSNSTRFQYDSTISLDGDAPHWTMCNIAVKDAHGAGNNILYPENGGLVSALNLTTVGKLFGPVDVEQVHLLTNINILDVPEGSETTFTSETTNFTYSGPWTEFQLPSTGESSSPPKKVRTSLCYDSL